ncbi:coiled-coil domain-containing protein 17 [Megalops cyprinoides]|uniref:coiled-coil domain-containing protein 17 n=1 Tax=Megalops cyprinoides TaxID=118141 RepID=UPI001864929B|nr:coiled-coil domain-containing protein 17 [Megalops cyprinoides]
METLGEYKCRNCDMAFRSLGLLDKHREHFCIGSDIGDPLILKQRNSKFMEPEDSEWGPGPKKAETPEFIRQREPRNELAGLRRWRERAGDMEGPSGKEQNLGGHVSNSLALRKLTDEFHKLRMSIEESMPTCPTQWDHRERVQEMAERHGQQLAEIQAHNRQLEQQREEIGRQLAELAGLGNTANLEKLLLELQEQEERNEEALLQLKGQIQTLQDQQGAKEDSVRPDSPTTGSHEDRKSQNINFDLISFGDGPLSGQIRALRLAYVQSGGSDPVVLAQMHDLQAEAHVLERARRKAEHKGCKKRSKPSQRALDSELLAVELENQRLEEEILRIQMARERHRGEEAAGAELQQMQREQIHQMAAVQAEIEYLRREVERAKEHPRERSHVCFQEQARPTLGRPVLDPLETLGPAPYDPGAGFVIFYDLVLGLDATLRTVRLLAGLYAGGQEIGRPVPLPAVPCQPGGGLPYAYGVPMGNYATLAVKQPVPRMQPSPSLSLVVELQAAGGLDSYGQEVQRLVSRGWAQLDLFDEHNQVQSGHWRVPFRALPLRPSLSTGQLNSVPQVGSMELCLRIANARDGDVQSLVNVEPGNASQYKYPSMVGCIKSSVS